jgi:hypothetical protein
VGSRWLFTAYDINARTIELVEKGNGSIVTTTPLTVDPISDAVNNVRFAVKGVAGDFDFAGITMRTRSFFKLQIPEAGHLTVIGHLTYSGVSTVTTIDTFGFLIEGVASLNLTAEMRVRVRDSNTNIVFTRNSPRKTLFDRSVTGYSTTTNTDLVDAGLFEEFLTVAPPDLVLPEHTIFVRIQYNINARAFGGAEFVADFDPGGPATNPQLTGPALGLNIPILIINFEPP